MWRSVLVPAGAFLAFIGAVTAGYGLYDVGLPSLVVGLTLLFAGRSRPGHDIPRWWIALVSIGLVVVIAQRWPPVQPTLVEVSEGFTIEPGVARHWQFEPDADALYRMDVFLEPDSITPVTRLSWALMSGEEPLSWGEVIGPMSSDLHRLDTRELLSGQALDLSIRVPDRTSPVFGHLRVEVDTADATSLMLAPGFTWFLVVLLVLLLGSQLGRRKRRPLSRISASSVRN